MSQPQHEQTRNGNQPQANIDLGVGLQLSMQEAGDHSAEYIRDAIQQQRPGEFVR
ncbi:hypothetical protein D3C78_810720 [compost metagenome]